MLKLQQEYRDPKTGERVMLELSIDEEELFKRLRQKALRSKHGCSTLAYDAVVCKVKK